MALEIDQDNEFDLVFVVGYQNFLQLSYIGIYKFINYFLKVTKNRPITDGGEEKVSRFVQKPSWIWF